ncbi:MAG: FemAB family PEP-CTERM system-associated protein [Desulfobacterales bacterium]|nr:FemAB family PEP-CTERM system-associated protein [Desulfobacterales bacterium]
MILNLDQSIVNSEKKLWDEYVTKHPESTPYHLFAWYETVKRAYKYNGHYLIAKTGNKICGVMPIIHMHMFNFFNRYVALPYCDQGDILADNIEIKQKLIHYAISMAQNNRINFIEIRNKTKDEHLHPNKVITLSQKVSMTLDIPNSSGALWNSFSSKLRSQIKKAKKNGLSFRIGGIELVEDFYYVFSVNMRNLGSPVHSKIWIMEIIRNYNKNARIGIVYYGHTPIGVGIIILTGKKAFVPWGSTLKRYNSLAPNMLLYWHFLEYAADNGAYFFDFGRSSIDEGTYRFKKQWGALPKQLYWHYILINKREFDSSLPSKREFVEQLWQKLPINIANLIGPYIRKHISL